MFKNLYGFGKSSSLGSKMFFFVLGRGFSVSDVTVGAYFHFFGTVYLAVGANTTGHFFGSCFFKTRPKSASEEPLNGFLAYLESKS